MPGPCGRGCNRHLTIAGGPQPDCITFTKSTYS